MPSLASALGAVTYLLYLFFRNTDLVLARQAHLVSSLRRERELRNLKSRFVTMVSHELRTPLATIRSAVDLLERYEERMTAEERREELAAVRTAVGGLTKMVDDVLALGRFDAAAKSNETRLNLEHFAQELWGETVRALAAPHRLELGGSAVDRSVLIDETFLRVVLSNPRKPTASSRSPTTAGAFRPTSATKSSKRFTAARARARPAVPGSAWPSPRPPRNVWGAHWASRAFPGRARSSSSSCRVCSRPVHLHAVRKTHDQDTRNRRRSADP
jgi:hypothetical protein